MTRLADDVSPGGPVDETFRALYRQYYPRVYRFFVARGFSREESRDLTQDTFIRVLRGISSLRGTDRFGTWLFEVARNVYLNELRHRATLKRSAFEFSLDELLAEDETAAQGDSGPVSARRSLDLPAVGAAPFDALVREERAQALSRALSRLPAKMRQCALLRLQGWEYREIAQVQAITVEAVRSHLHEAIRRLKQTLGEDHA